MNMDLISARDEAFLELVSMREKYVFPGVEDEFDVILSSYYAALESATHIRNIEIIKNEGMKKIMNLSNSLSYKKKMAKEDIILAANTVLCIANSTEIMRIIMDTNYMLDACGNIEALDATKASIIGKILNLDINKIANSEFNGGNR